MEGGIYIGTVFNKCELIFEILVLGRRQGKRIYIIEFIFVIILLLLGFGLLFNKVIVFLFSRLVFTVASRQLLKLRDNGLRMKSVGDMNMIVGIQYLLIVILTVDIHPIGAKITKLCKRHHLTV